MKKFFKGLNAVVLFLYIFTMVILLICGSVLGMGGEEAAARWVFSGVIMLFYFGLGYLVGKKLNEQ